MSGKQRPNVLLIMADQLTPYALGCYGNREVKTPEIDGLAERGVRFENAYCNSPLCTPSRASMLTGRYVQHLRCWDNGTPFPTETPTIMHYLGRAGYSAIASGKLHFVGPDQLHGFHERLTPDIYPAGMWWTYDWDRDIRRAPIKSLKHGPVESNSEFDYDALVQLRATHRLRRLCRQRDPFFLTVSYTSPHPPFTATRPYWDLYEGVDIALPKWPAREIANEHPLYQWVRRYHRLGKPPREEDVYSARRAYYAKTSYVDEMVGQLLRILDQTGVRDRTIVLFLSDHGEMLGEHGHWCKRVPFEWSAKVPILLSWPGTIPGGKAVQEVVSLVDILPSVLELVRLEPPVRSDGASLVPLMRGSAKGWQNEALSENYTEGVKASSCMLRRDRYKYVGVVGHDPILYDLEADPGEHNNVSGTPDYAEVERDMRQRLAALWDGGRIEREVRTGKRERFVINDALRNGNHEPWDHFPRIRERAWLSSRWPITPPENK